MSSQWKLHRRRTAACSTFTAQSGTSKAPITIPPAYYRKRSTRRLRVSCLGNQGDFARAIFEVTGGPFIQVSTGPPSGYASVGQPAKGQVGSHVSVEGSNYLTTDTSCTVGGVGVLVLISGGTAACAVFTSKWGYQRYRQLQRGNVRPGQYLVQISGNQGDLAGLVNVTSGPFIQCHQVHRTDSLASVK